MSDDTATKLSKLSDDAAFERIATAVLRIAKPEYARLVHTGINEDGKTVKAPIDGIGFVEGADPPHLVTAHHTTCKRDDLEGKWLHDPSTVKPRKGTKPTAPAGDVVKTLKLVDEERERTPRLLATLALTTNRIPPEKLVRDVEYAGSVKQVDVDIWDVTRLAHVLDTDPAGQMIRRRFLGADVQMLSEELLRELSRASLMTLSLPEPESWVTRQLDDTVTKVVARQSLVFVSADSGMGKTVACYKHLERHIAAGGFGLVLRHEVLAETNTVEQAIDRTIRALAPALSGAPGSEALAFCSPDRPLVLFVEDVNKSGQAAQLVEKVSGWLPQPSGDAKQPDAALRPERWRAVCPIWPEVVTTVRDDVGRRVLEHTLFASPFDAAEGREAVLLRARNHGRSISDIEADEVSERLGHDPLLIALHEPGSKASSQRVLSSFIDGSFARQRARPPHYTPGEYRAALHRLGHAMLSNRDLEPTTSVALRWTAGAEPLLRQLLGSRELLRPSGGVDEERIAFRHDRVRDALLSQALVQAIITNSLEDAVAAEPFYAELLGAAALDPRTPAGFVDRMERENILALFHALRLSHDPKNPVLNRIAAALNRWVNEPSNRSQAHRAERLAALASLARTDDTRVLGLARRIPDDSIDKFFALFRNGGLDGGLNLCLWLEPGVGSSRRDQLIAYVKKAFGPETLLALNQLLRSCTTDRGARLGALHLAGHLAEPQLAQAIGASWDFDPVRTDETQLRAYLWAGARCCEEPVARLLGPICDAWAALPDVPVSEGLPSMRDDLAGGHLRFAFEAEPPVSAVPYLVARAAQPKLEWPITYLLHAVDCPEAVEFTARQLASPNREMFSMSTVEDWRRRHERRRPMSSASRDRLSQLWASEGNAESLRRHAFRIWCVTAGASDLDVLRGIPADGSLGDAALWQRLTLSDATAVPAMVLKVKHSPRWWMAGRFLTASALTKTLDDELGKLGDNVDGDPELGERTYALAERLFALPGPEVEGLLVKHWPRVHTVARICQVALHVATPRTLALVKSAVAASDEPARLFRSLGTNYGLRTQARPGITRREQVEALIPYLEHLDVISLHGIWDECNRHGWYDLRRSHLDAHLPKGRRHTYADEQENFRALDRLSEGQGSGLQFWLDNFAKCGAKREEVLATVRRWLHTRKDPRAWVVAANAVRMLGHRADLELLNVALDPSTSTEAPRASLEYELKRRTLR